MDKLNQAKDVKKDGQAFSGVVSKPIRVAGALSQGLVNLTGGESRGYQQEFQKMNPLRSLDKVPIVGGITSGISNVAQNLGNAVGNILGEDYNPIVKGYNGRELNAEEYQQAERRAYQRYQQTGNPIQNVMGYRVEYTKGRREPILNEFMIGKKMFDLRQKQSKVELEKRSFTNSNKGFETVDIDGDTYFFYRIHMYGRVKVGYRKNPSKKFMDDIKQQWREIEDRKKQLG